jgi:hypothetical protein
MAPAGGSGGDGNPGAGGGAGGGIAVDCTRNPLPPPASVRLVDRQFRNTVAALFPFPVDIGNKYPVTSFKGQFTTSTAANEVLYADIQSFTETAESIALQAVGRMAELMSCTPVGDGMACAQQFIDGFATKAFRRPVTADERARLLALYAAVRSGTDPLDFTLAIAAVIAEVLQSPHFLYRLELGEPSGMAGVRRLTQHEIASRLSYLFWESPPDERLMTKARLGALGTAQAIGEEASRLLADARGKAAAGRFFSEWMGYGDTLYDSRVDRALATDFSEEARRFVQGVVFDSPGAALRDLFDNDRTVVTRRLAAHYGLPTDGLTDTDWRAVNLPARQRAGILAKAQQAASDSALGETSFIKRGHFVLEQLLCFDLGVPPPNAQAMAPQLPADATVRQRSDALIATNTCGACHQHLNGAGMGMEDLDHLGRHRTRYASGSEVDAAGKLLTLGANGDFLGTAGLAKKLADNDLVARCAATQWYRYASGHRESDDEASCHVNLLRKRFADTGYNLRELLLGIVASDAFIYRTDR